MRFLTIRRRQWPRSQLSPIMLLGSLIALFSDASPAPALQLQSVTTPWIRANNALDHLRLDPKGRFLAFTGMPGQQQAGLSVLDTKTKNIFQVTSQPVGAAFFWSPDGYRLFYRELYKLPPGATKMAALAAIDGSLLVPTKKKSDIRSVLKAYDCAFNRHITLDELPFQTGFLTFDPRDLRLHLLGIAGVHTKRINFPGERLARWQTAQRSGEGKFIASQNGILWLTQGGTVLRRLDDDQSAVESFDISPDGTAIAWSTAIGRIYVSKSGEPSQFLSYGRDPRWHPDQPLLVAAGARMVGDKAINYDLKIIDLKGSGRFLTQSQFVDERWPQWYAKDNKIVYTIAKTTDIYLLEFK